MKKALNFLMILSAIAAACQSGDDTTADQDDDPEGENPQLFSVMSFNIRHHNDNDPQPLDLRKNYILNIITENDPDIVGLQEFSNNWFEDWMTAEMKDLGYMYYMDASAGKGSPKVIFFRSDRFTLRGQATFQMNHTENRSGTWVILNDNVNHREYFVTNSHWTTVSSAERVSTAREVLSVIRDKYRQLPVVAFGDFNAKPGSPKIQLLKDHTEPALTPALDESQKTFHRWDATGSSKLDWIFHSPELTVEESEVIRTSYNTNWPSDHWPVMATFSIDN